MNEQDYLKLRREIVDENLNLMGVVVNEDERRADMVLDSLKKEFKSGYKLAPYDMPVLTDKKIPESRLYDFCKKLPKGSDLHVHGTALIPMHRFIDFIAERQDIVIDIDTLVLHPAKLENARRMPLGEALSKGLVTVDRLFSKWTLIGVEKDEDLWHTFEDIFSFFEAVDDDMQILYDYYVAAFEYYVSVNIQHAEIHLCLPDDEKKCFLTVKTIKNAYHKVRETHPDFSVSIIGCGMKIYDVDFNQIMENVNSALVMKEMIKDDFPGQETEDFILGFDLVNEEDTSRPLKDFAGKLIEFKEKYPDFKYFLHSGESLEIASSNLIDAYLIGASRVGHGINLYRYPKLLRDYADKEICIESCLISNKSLGYVKDLRLHPSLEYIKRGVTVALCSDDPMFFENETLVDDFFAAILCWDLSIADVKQLCINSIMYSGLAKDSKLKLMRSWRENWKNFIAEIIN